MLFLFGCKGTIKWAHIKIFFYFSLKFKNNLEVNPESDDKILKLRSFDTICSGDE